MRSKTDWLSRGVYISDDVDGRRIAADAVIHPGCRIQGAETCIGPGSMIGGEDHAVIDNCRLGRKVELKGGYFCGAVFLDGSSIGSGAHIRPGTIIEEEASCAHAVGLKQSILFPFVTGGSLINFCDALMAGGTRRNDHSEIGSSYVHFNFTPHQDKATASLIGDVPNGVFLDRKPIFLGGQGGLVGPSRIAFGSVLAAGGTCRSDLLKEGQLHIPEAPRPGTRDYTVGVYRNAARLIRNNLIYMGNILALREWYSCIRTRFVRDEFDQAVLEGARLNLELILKERQKQLGRVAANFESSFQWLESNYGRPEEIDVQRRFNADWPALRIKFEEFSFQPPDPLVKLLKNKASYIETIHSLEPDIRESGRVWLQSIVNKTAGLWK